MHASFPMLCGTNIDSSEAYITFFAELTATWFYLVVWLWLSEKLIDSWFILLLYLVTHLFYGSLIDRPKWIVLQRLIVLMSSSIPREISMQISACHYLLIKILRINIFLRLSAGVNYLVKTLIFLSSWTSLVICPFSVRVISRNRLPDDLNRLQESYTQK